MNLQKLLFIEALSRPSLVDEVAKVTAVFEQQIQELTALVASMREETTALRAKMALKEA